MDKQLVVFGGGSLAVEIAAYVADMRDAHDSGAVSGERWAISDVVSDSTPRADDLRRQARADPEFHADLGSVSDLARKSVVIAIGDPAVRHRIYRQLLDAGVRLATLVHPRAYVAGTASIGPGCVIAPFAFVGPFATLGANVVLNVGAIVGHDVVLGTSCVLSPGAKMNGFAKSGDVAFLGAGAVMQSKAALGSYGKLSAGSVLTGIAGDGFLMHGNPAAGRQMVKLP